MQLGQKLLIFRESRAKKNHFDISGTGAYLPHLTFLIQKGDLGLGSRKTTFFRTWLLNTVGMGSGLEIFLNVVFDGLFLA